MDKTDFIAKLKELTNYDEEKCNIINDVVQNNFWIGKDAKDKIVNALKERLHISDEDVEKLYNICKQILGDEVMDKIGNGVIDTIKGLFNKSEK